MHITSFKTMQKFVLSLPESGTVLDVGSMNINGCYKALFNKKWQYTGVDISAGPNVDIVLSNPDKWVEIADNSFDVVISGQALEHVEHDDLVVDEMIRALKPGGLLCLIVPSKGPKHCPPDYRRYTEDSLSKLLGDKMAIISSGTGVAGWCDVCVVSKKG
jgi:SAM-dependent methyltransferase